MEGGFFHSGSAVVNPLLGVNERTVNPNDEPLEMVLGSSTNVRAWIMSYLAPS